MGFKVYSRLPVFISLIMGTLKLADLLCIGFVAFATCNVAFKVQYSANTHFTAFKEIMVFDNVVLDTRSAYNPHTGIFTAPSTGVYMFNVLLETFESDDHDFFLQRNGQSEASMTIKSGQNSGQMTTIAKVDAGDTIHVGRGDGLRALNKTGMDFTQFSGVVIIKAESK